MMVWMRELLYQSNITRLGEGGSDLRAKPAMPIGFIVLPGDDLHLLLLLLLPDPFSDPHQCLTQ